MSWVLAGYSPLDCKESDMTEHACTYDLSAGHGGASLAQLKHF